MGFLISAGASYRVARCRACSIPMAAAVASTTRRDGQVGVGLAAAAGLLIWLWRTVPGITFTATAPAMGSSLTLGLTV